MAERPAARRRQPVPPQRRTVLLRWVVPGAAAVATLVLAGWWARSVVAPGPTLVPLQTGAAKGGPPVVVPSTIDSRPVVQRPAGVVELCGFGAYEPSRDEGAFPPHVQQAAARLLLAQTGDAAAAVLTPTQRAAALFVAMAAEDVRQSTAPDAHACQSDPRCVAASDEALAAARRDSIEALVRQATMSRDGVAYGLAWRACVKLGGDRLPACAHISAAQWAQVESDNLMAWLAAGREASTRGDAVARDAAYLRASQAPRARWAQRPVLTLLDAPAVSGAAPATRLSVATLVQGVNAAAAPPDYAIDYCNDAAAARDETRRTICRALADNLERRGGEVLDLLGAGAIGRAAGWPPDRLQQLRDRRDLLQAVAANQSLDIWSCDAAQRLPRQLAKMGAEGEIAWLQAQLAASGEDPAALLARWRATQPQTKRD